MSINSYANLNKLSTTNALAYLGAASLPEKEWFYEKDAIWSSNRCRQVSLSSLAIDIN
jgi:hypothetical protein